MISTYYSTIFSISILWLVLVRDKQQAAFENLKIFYGLKIKDAWYNFEKTLHIALRF